MPESNNIVFTGYFLGSKLYAVFLDLQSGENHFFDKKECLDRLKKLKENKFDSEETQKAIDNWP